MLPSTDGRSFEQVWADFFQRFGQNCNTCREEGKREKNIIILPDGLDVDAALKELGTVRGERYLLLINQLYFRGLYRKKTKNAQGSFLPIHRNTLVEVGGNRYSELLQYGFQHRHIKKSPQTYIVDVRSNEYRLGKELLNFKRQRVYSLTTKAAIRIWENRHKKRRAAFVKNSVARQKIARSVDGLRFDYSGAFDFVAKIQDQETKVHRVAVLSQLITDGQMWTVDKQGRNYTTLVQIPSELRAFFSHLGRKLCIIDIGSSQPLLHGLLYEDTEPEKAKYLSVVHGGFWKFMNDATGQEFDLNDPDEKQVLKEGVFGQVFYGRSDVDAPRGKYGRAFKTAFPVLWGLIGEAKRGNHRLLPRTMQFIEAEGVSGVVETLSQKPYPLITIHDAIVTTSDDATEVEHAIREVFAEMKLEPRLSMKILEP